MMMREKNSVCASGANIAWFILVVATGIGWWLGHASQSGGQGERLATAGVIIVAFIKVWIVGFQFMELRHAPRWLRLGYDAWTVVICATLVIICLG